MAALLAPEILGAAGIGSLIPKVLPAVEKEIGKLVGGLFKKHVMPAIKRTVLKKGRDLAQAGFSRAISSVAKSNFRRTLTVNAKRHLTQGVTSAIKNTHRLSDIGPGGPLKVRALSMGEPIFTGIPLGAGPITRRRRRRKRKKSTKSGFQVFNKSVLGRVSRAPRTRSKKVPAPASIVKGKAIATHVAHRVATNMPRRKRRRTSVTHVHGGGSVTGGTGDVKPQILTLTTADLGAEDDYVVAEIALPVPRLGHYLGHSSVFEFLKVWFYVNIKDTADVLSNNFICLSTTQIRTSGDTCTLTTIQEDIQNTRVFAASLESRFFTTNGMTHRTLPLTIDLTDSNGNGVLIATDKIHLTGGNIAGSAGAVGAFVCKLLYRIVNVGIEEYVGIVQGQQ